MNKNKLSLTIGMAVASTLILAGCGGSSSSDNESTAAEELSRDHDEREFIIDVASLGAFQTNTLTGEEGANQVVQDASRYAGIYEGIQGNAGYTVEIPENWDGKLIMWTRGFSDDGVLGANPPTMAFRNAVLAAGYAWAASTYSADYYDVRAAIEDTNKLALNFSQIIADNHDVPVAEVTQRLIAGNSLGGHTAAAAVEQETIDRAQFSVAYEGSMPLCQAEQNEFYWLGDYARVAQELAGQGDEPHENFQDLRDLIEAELFVFDENGDNTWQPQSGAGENLKGIAMNLTGGERPVFDQGFVFAGGALQNVVLDTGGADGTISGILARNFYDNQDREYRWTDGEITQAEEEFNDSITRVSADPNVNPLRDDGVRWLPLVKGEISVPVLTLHTLGDFFVPFRHQQLFRNRVEENGNGDLLVQRAIRAPGHCDFSAEEITTATEDFLDWVNNDVVPEGDDVISPETVSDPQYGCDHTENGSRAQERAFFGVPACEV